MNEQDVSMSNQDRLEVELMKACEDATGKDNRFVSKSSSDSMLLSFTEGVCISIFVWFWQ